MLLVDLGRFEVDATNRAGSTRFHLDDHSSVFGGYYAGFGMFLQRIDVEALCVLGILIDLHQFDVLPGGAGHVEPKLFLLFGKRRHFDSVFLSRKLFKL